MRLAKYNAALVSTKPPLDSRIRYHFHREVLMAQVPLNG